MRLLSIAPMMDHTDRHFRFALRQLTRHTLLYTEMITANALLRGEADRLLAWDLRERPVALQLGGDDPRALAAAARLAEEAGYDEVNLNCGCPSPRVQRGAFGAALMATPERVADAVAAMRAAVSVPVTVKHRIGIDLQDSYEDMARFVEIVAGAGCTRFTVHARKAWLHGLSPKDNRTIPPLRYADVWRLKASHPHLEVEINGGLRTLEAAREQLGHVDAVMIGRAAVDTPMIFASADQEIFGDVSAPAPSPDDVVEALLPYLAAWNAAGGASWAVLRHLLNLYTGRPGARVWRQHLTAEGRRPGVLVLTEARRRVSEAQAAIDLHARWPRSALSPSASE